MNLCQIASVTNSNHNSIYSISHDEVINMFSENDLYEHMNNEKEHMNDENKHMKSEVENINNDIFYSDDENEYNKMFESGISAVYNEINT